MSPVVFELQIIDGLAVMRRPTLSPVAKILACEHYPARYFPSHRVIGINLTGHGSDHETVDDSYFFASFFAVIGDFDILGDRKSVV